MPEVSNRRKRIHLIANAKSGKGAGENIAELAQRLCDEHDVELIQYDINNPPHSLDEKAKEAVKAAQGTDDVVLAAGGDGTIRCVAEKAYKAKVHFAVVSCGTFNYFARTHGIPEDHEQALRLAITGKGEPVRLGEFNGRIFLINATMGLYATSIQEREENTKKFGRKRFVVILSTIRTLLRPHRLLDVTLKTYGVESFFRTPLLFIGNNALQLRNLSLSVAGGFKKDLLAVVSLKPVRGWEMLRVIFRGVTRTLEKEERLEQFNTESIVINTKRRHQTVALDGELFEMTSPFLVNSIPEALNLVKPPPSLQTQPTEDQTQQNLGVEPIGAQL